MSDDKAKLLQQHVMIDYTNHAGVRQIRQIVPSLPNGLAFGATPWHPEPQWTITAYDIRKDDLRTFAIRDIHQWAPANTAVGRSMMSWAKQLQASMERNARMSNRLKGLAERAGKTDPSNFTPHDLLLRITTELPMAISAILKDEEPTWPEA